MHNYGCAAARTEAMRGPGQSERVQQAEAAKLDAAIAAVLRVGEVIADYPEDAPFPSRLLLGFALGQPVHVVVARDPESGACFVVTVYRPDPQLWEQDHKTRRQS